MKTRELEDSLSQIEKLQEQLEVARECRADSHSDGTGDIDTMECTGGPEEHSPMIAHMNPCGEEGLHRNTLGLPVDPYGAVQWEKLLNASELDELRLADQDGLLKCHVCHATTVSMSGNYGNIYITDDGKRWEEKNLLGILGDWPKHARCFRCHPGTVQCKFWKRGFCARSSYCPYLHDDEVDEGGQALGPKSATERPEPLHTPACFLEAADVMNLSCVSRGHLRLARHFLMD